ncbi:diguanylate cyclase [Massilia sp. PWRC2]|uniref:GGDEF domain-containing protein n=1 Tax=Massilia sp. PWRC2 TaxID=2804626 RepID=UPI003CF570BE
MSVGLPCPPQRRLLAALLLCLSLCAAPVQAQSQLPAAAAAKADPVADFDLQRQLADIRELNRYQPSTALAMLGKIAVPARAASIAVKAEFLDQLCLSYRMLGERATALKVAEELIAFGRASGDKVALAKGLLAKGFVLYTMDQLAPSHALAWEGAALAETTDDMALRISANIVAGQAYSEDGNFPEALKKMQAAVTLARSYDRPIHSVMALNALATLYGEMKEYERGFQVLAEAYEAAAKAHSPVRVAALKKTEYALSIDTNQPKRARAALLAGLEIQRRIGATTMIPVSLVNISDSYLQERDYRQTLEYAHLAIEAALPLKDTGTEAIARINIGQAYLGMGRLAEGKRSFEAGLAVVERTGAKPALQEVLLEYGGALERAGDFAGAVQAYHRERALSIELFEGRRQKALLELQGKYEADKKERQIELLRRDNQIKGAELSNRRLQQRIWWLLAVVGALVVLIVGFLYRKVRSANALLEVRNHELKQQSSRDPLTALYNRRHFQEFMRARASAEALIEQRGEQRAASAVNTGEDTVAALFLLDVDHFKHVNDSYGHATGDAVLTMISNNLRVILRETDMIVRWGGEEFLAFLPAVPRDGLDDIASRLLAGISAHAISCNGRSLNVNVSIGYAPFPLSPGEQQLPWERAVNLVDMALYMAKSHGRNRAYGVRGFAAGGSTTIEQVEHDLEAAWRAGVVDLSVVLGGDAANVTSDAELLSA